MKIVRHTHCSTYGFQSKYFSIIYRFRFICILCWLILCRSELVQTAVLLEMYVISFDRSIYWGGKPNNQKTISTLWKPGECVCFVKVAPQKKLKFVFSSFTFRKGNVILPREKKSLIFVQNMCGHFSIEGKISIAHLICGKSQTFHHMECNRINVILLPLETENFTSYTENMAYAFYHTFANVVRFENTFLLFVAFRTESVINYTSTDVAYGLVFFFLVYGPSIAMMKNNWRKHTFCMCNDFKFFIFCIAKSRIFSVGADTDKEQQRAQRQGEWESCIKSSL